MKLQKNKYIQKIMTFKKCVLPGLMSQAIAASINPSSSYKPSIYLFIYLFCKLFTGLIRSSLLLQIYLNVTQNGLQT